MHSTQGEDLALRSSFGRHIKRMREVRKLTQEQLAERSDLAADTIRRLERSDFSPSLNTLRKVSTGLGITVPVLFEGFELLKSDPVFDDIVSLLHGRDQKILVMVLRVVQPLLEHVEQCVNGASEPEAGASV